MAGVNATFSGVNDGTLGAHSPAAEQEAQAVHDDHDGTAFMPHHSQSQWDAPSQGKGNKDDDCAQRYHQVLSDNPAGPLTQTERPQEVFQTVMHQHDVSLLESRI